MGDLRVETPERRAQRLREARERAVSAMIAAENALASYSGAVHHGRDLGDELEAAEQALADRIAASARQLREDGVPAIRDHESAEWKAAYGKLAGAGA